MAQEEHMVRCAVLTWFVLLLAVSCTPEQRRIWLGSRDPGLVGAPAPSGAAPGLSLQDLMYLDQLERQQAYQEQMLEETIRIRKQLQMQNSPLARWPR
jgi:hypothetical protein